MKIELIHGDCLEKMSEIDKGSVDLILCDLPYGTTQNKWDSVIPFDSLWSEVWGVLKLNGVFASFAAQPFSSLLVASQIKYHKYEWVWVKNLKTGNLNARKMPMGGHETIQIFYQKPCTYNPQKRKRTTEQKSGNKFNSKTSNYGSQGEVYLDRQSDEINPDTALLNFKCVHNSSGKVHPTQKPTELCEYLIKTYTNNSEIVLDFVMGSGTTGVACLNTNRSFIGIEKDDHYFNVSVDRIRNKIKELNTDVELIIKD